MRIFTHSQPVSNKWDLQLLQPPKFHNLKEKHARSCQLCMGGIPSFGSAHVPANTPALANLFNPFIFGDEGQSAELITS